LLNYPNREVNKKMIEIDGIEIRRFPENSSAPIEDCFALCEQAGYSVLSMDYIAQLRARHPEKGHPAWTQIQKAYSGSVVGVGILEGGIPTIVVAHRNHPLMTSGAIRRFKDYPQRFVNGAITFPEAEVLGMINPYKDCREPKRDVWVIQTPHLIDPQFLNSGVVLATIDGTARTLLKPFLGDRNIATSYLMGHRNNFHQNIGIFFDENALNSEGLLFRPLWFGSDYNSLDGNDGYLSSGCVFGVPSCATPILPSLDDILFGSE
jgi:hypothetical protein